jgi:GT2 family glycosyltransferase
VSLPIVYAILINWNGEKDTIACLESLLTVNYASLHVLISDNGSRPESIAAIREWIAENLAVGRLWKGIGSCEILENGRNLGFTGGNTIGIHYALKQNADYVLFLNNDTIVTPNFLKPMVDVAECDKNVGIVGCKIFYADSDPGGRHRIWSLGGYSFRHGMPINIGAGELDRPEWKGVREQTLINGCCMLIKRAVVETVGVQDDRLFFGIDDVEYSFRAAQKGWKNVIACNAEIYHAASRSVVPRSGLQVYYLFRNILFFRCNSFPVWRNLDFVFFFLVRYVFVASLYRLLTGRNKVNHGVMLAIWDFVRGQMGECRHASSLVAT